MKIKHGLLVCVFLFLQGHLIGRSDAADTQPPPVLHYNFTDPGNNVTCMMAEFSAQLKFSAPDGSTVIVNDGQVNETVSKCDGDEEKLVIDFHHNNASNQIAFTFLNTTDQAKLAEIHLIFGDRKFKVTNQTLFQVPLANSYRCKSGLDVFMEQGDNGLTTLNVTLNLRDMRFDVFRTSKNHDYDSDYVCAADIKGNKTVPMIVAFVLAGMVVIILVGYLILRRREDRSAYQSV